MKFFYSASTMGYGYGYKWHYKYNFPSYPRVTRTLTWDKRTGLPFAIVKYGESVWNKVSLHNIGIFNWLHMYHYRPWVNIIVSIAGYDAQIANMLYLFEDMKLNIAGVELNFSCPNIKGFNNVTTPKTRFPLYLKLNHTQNPYDYDLDNVAGIRLNSVPTLIGGLSGKAAQKKNWEWIEKYANDGFNDGPSVAGCSFTSIDDIMTLSKMGCREIGIGSIIMTNPRLVEQIGALNLR
jgi:dihydroorotate dehydrogenase